MVKLTGKPAYTKRADSGSVLWSEEDHPGPSVHGAQRSVWRDFFASIDFMDGLDHSEPLMILKNGQTMSTYLLMKDYAIHI